MLNPKYDNYFLSPSQKLRFLDYLEDQPDGVKFTCLQLVNNSEHTFKMEFTHSKIKEKAV